jgi:hypothetical protein
MLKIAGQAIGQLLSMIQCKHTDSRYKRTNTEGREILMSRSFKRFYLTALFPLIFLSAYPVAMGTGIAVLSFQNGRILPEYYEQTVIPYAAVCSSILLTLLLYPLLSKLRRFSLPSATVFAAGLFLGLEWYMENITIHSPEALSAYKWQLESHIGSAEATQAFQMLYDNTYRIHYYITSLMLIVLVIGLIYSYENRIQSEEGGRKNLFRLQLIFTILFVVFCAFVNAASYLRKVSFLTEAVDYLISLSPTLTVFFNLVMSLAFGLYMAGFLSGKRRLVSVFIPAAAAILTAGAMYYGEYRMLDGILYRFGYTKVFQSLPYTIVTAADAFVILGSGALTALFIETLSFFSRKGEKPSRLHEEKNEGTIIQ